MFYSEKLAVLIHIYLGGNIIWLEFENYLKIISRNLYNELFLTESYNAQLIVQ